MEMHTPLLAGDDLLGSLFPHTLPVPPTQARPRNPNAGPGGGRGPPGRAAGGGRGAPRGGHVPAQHPAGHLQRGPLRALWPGPAGAATPQGKI